ncbi:MAG: metal ABC transporter ATP-binding protein [Candidatus Nomurabacteria bacterium]|nr:metal ABC transporter ATP-binding protein [Candidatus Nomurabacteria bacterium]USN88237.1 MAG: metal ABC transporter ATP-binding protein [Candidatus Nomurabacteria bacterium]
MNDKDNAIDLSDVSVRYGDNQALSSASISIPYGTFTGVIGMNGAGKSTLFKVIMGLVTPDSGSVRVCGDAPKTAQKHGHVAYVPQAELVDWDFPVSVYDVVMMGRIGLQNIFKTPTDVDKKHVDEALRKVNMQDFRNRQIGELSGGQKKRAFVARALAQGADILLLDEPFAGLDAVSERSLTELLVSLKEEGKTVILAAHELTSLSDNCDRVALIKHTVLAYGPTKEVFTKDLITKTFDGLIHHIKFEK